MTATTATVTYTRGTKTEKVTSASVPAGTVLLGVLVDAAEGLVKVADSKTGAELREVARTERVAPGAYERTVRVIVHFTDGTRSARCAPSQTWMAVVPTAATVLPAPVAPLEVVTLDGEELSVEVTATPAAEATTKAYRIGKLLREFVLAGDDNGHHAVSAALRDHVASRNVCYDGTATLRLTPAFAEELINAASEMDAEAKAAARAARRVLYALFA